MGLFNYELILKEDNNLNCSYENYSWRKIITLNLLGDLKSFHGKIVLKVRSSSFKIALKVRFTDNINIEDPSANLTYNYEAPHDYTNALIRVRFYLDYDYYDNLFADGGKCFSAFNPSCYSLYQIYFMHILGSFQSFDRVIN